MRHALIGRKFNGSSLEIAQGSLEKVAALQAGLTPELGDEWLEFVIVELEPEPIAATVSSFEGALRRTA